MVLSDIENELDYAIDDEREVDSTILDEPDVSTEDKEPVAAADIDPTMPAEDAKVSDEIQMETEEVPDQSVTPIDKVPDDSKLSITYDSSNMPIPNGINVENSPEMSYDPSLMPSIEVKVPNVKKHPSIQKRLEKIKSKVVAKAVSSIHNRNLQPKVDGEAEKEELEKLHRLKVSTDGHIATVRELLGDTSLLSVDVLIELQGALTDGIRDLARAQNRIHSVTFSRYFYQRRKNRKETSPVSQDVETLSNSFQTLSLEVADLCDDLSDKLTVRFKEVSNKAPPEEPCCSSSLKRSNNRPIVCSPPKAEKRDEPVQSIAAVPRGESVRAQQEVAQPAVVNPDNVAAPERPRFNIQSCTYCGRGCWSASCQYVTSREERIALLDQSGRCLRCLARHSGKCLSSHVCRICRSAVHHQSICPFRRPSPQ